MDVGMLWFDNDKSRDLSSKIARAAAYYREKYGIRPNLCFVHPTMMKNPALGLEKIEIRPTNSMLPNHLWIGQGSM